LHNLQALNQVEGYANSSVTAEIQYVNEESSILQRIDESMAELEKLRKEIRDYSIDLINVIEKKLKEIDIKMAELK
jgi:GMP synthase PP-ATPase subunit